jgi:cytochrome d ubiquinol oxidase subunit II
VTLADLLAGVTLVALVLYAVTGGADFGGGVWEAFASGPRKREQRRLIEQAITPIWEVDHVWVILVVVLLFTCFPTAFSRLSIVLHIPVTLLLVGIVLRGAAFTFRAYDSSRDEVQRRWGTIFAAASIVSPVLLGVVVGAVAAGRVVVHAEGGFAERFVHPWLTPFPWAVGLFALVLFSYLAAVYLTVEAREGGLQEDFRRRALVGAGATFVTAFGVLLWSGEAAPRVRDGLIASAWALPLHAATGLAAIGAIWALWERRYREARAAAVLQVAFIVAGWGLAQYPYMLPPDLTIAAAAAPVVTLRLVAIVLAAGAVLLIPSLWYLFRVFKARPGR